MRNVIQYGGDIFKHEQDLWHSRNQKLILATGSRPIVHSIEGVEKWARGMTQAMIDSGYVEIVKDSMTEEEFVRLSKK